MPERPLVSVVIIFLNPPEPFFREAIASVFTQTYDHWELLLVDDGSTNGASKIATDRARQYPARVRYLEHEGHRNIGAPASRNAGIANSRGKYIAFLDADDVWLPRKLEQQVTILETYPKASMVFGSSLYWHSWTGEPKDARRDFIPAMGVPADTLLKPPSMVTLSYPLGSVHTPGPTQLMFHREMMERIGPLEESFKGDYQLYEDQVFLAKVYLNESVFVSGEVLEKYRIHPDSCANKTSKRNAVAARLMYLRWLAGYLQQQGVKDQEIWKAVERAFWPHRHPVLSSVRDQIRRVGRGVAKLAKSLKRRDGKGQERRIEPLAYEDPRH